jgi:hypothetical protein
MAKGIDDRLLSIEQNLIEYNGRLTKIETIVRAGLWVLATLGVALAGAIVTIVVIR